LTRLKKREHEKEEKERYEKNRWKKYITKAKPKNSMLKVAAKRTQ